ncbi:MAG TPA: tetratricopeptide repeat protein, partial [Oxalicibacterium sp.]|nr:tetratricopeptide repeat protein [Oxalicibacterium sp.]
RPDQAIDAYQKALMLNSTDAKVWHNLGVVRVRQAWAAFIQSYALVKGDDALRAKLDGLIGAMEKIPLEGLSRAPKGANPAATDVHR